MIFALDSSFIVKLVIEEEHSREASRIFNDGYLRELEFIASELVLYEVGNVLWKRLRRRKRDGSEFLEMVCTLDLEYVPLDNYFLKASMKVAQVHDISFYDAVHVAVAQSRAANLISDDRKLRNMFDFTLSIREACDLLCE